MMNTMTIDGYKAVIKYDPILDTFRGEFIGLNGGADFYGTDIQELKKEGRLSLTSFLDLCESEGIQPTKNIPGSSTSGYPRNSTQKLPPRRRPRAKALISVLKTFWTKCFIQNKKITKFAKTGAVPMVGTAPAV